MRLASEPVSLLFLLHFVADYAACRGAAKRARSTAARERASGHAADCRTHGRASFGRRHGRTSTQTAGEHNDNCKFRRMFHDDLLYVEQVLERLDDACHGDGQAGYAGATAAMCPRPAAWAMGAYPPAPRRFER